MGKWEIDYFYLQNSVETDIVEKYLINQLKPVINEKDKVTDLTFQLKMDLPDWHPYEEYLEQHRHVRLNMEYQIALTHVELFDEIIKQMYDPDWDKYIYTSHKNDGKLPMPIGESMEWESVVLSCEGDNPYKQLIDFSSYETAFDLYPNRILASIWERTALEYAFTDTQKEILYLLKQGEYLVSFLRQLQINGYIQEEGMERDLCKLSIPEEVVTKWGFDKIIHPISYRNGKLLFIVQEDFSYLDRVLEQIAKEKMYIYRTCFANEKDKVLAA